MKYSELGEDEARSELERVREEYERLKAAGTKLDMSRGKPSPEQLNLSDPVSGAPEGGCVSASGVDTRNYGGVEGLPEARRLFAEIFGVDPSLVLVGGNSSLNLMFDAVAQGLYKGYGGGEPWLKQGDVKFLCPVPGYDRHFAICEYLGIGMIPVPMNDDGPLISEVERRVADPLVKGMWCVPRFSNPGGVTYSDEVVKSLARLRPAAPDFKIFWDNAYAVHTLAAGDRPLLNIYNEAAPLGNADMIIQFASTSKITYAGAGVAALCSGERTVAELRRRLSFQTIGPDKLSQLRHTRFLPDLRAVEAQMRRHAEILTPKFDTVTDGLRSELGSCGIAHWNEPRGGYFISLYVLKGCAKRVVSLCREAGLTLTDAGAAYPYGKDPDDSLIRVAPSYPSVVELKAATHLLAVAVKLAALEKLTGGS